MIDMDHFLNPKHRRITQGTFSFLPDLTDEQITAQIQYALDNGWALNVEYTDDPHPRNTYWEMWCQPLFDTKDAAAVMMELRECRKIHGGSYIKINAYNPTRGRETVALSFIVNRPKEEPGFGGRPQRRPESSAPVPRAQLCDRPPPRGSGTATNSGPRRWTNGRAPTDSDRETDAMTTEECRSRCGTRSRRRRRMCPTRSISTRSSGARTSSRCWISSTAS